MTLWSNKKSIAHNEISLLAIFEIIFAVFLYWLIALYFNTYWHIIISIFIAPIFLISSEESKKKGLDLLDKWTKLSYEDITLEIRLIMVAITLFIITLFSYLSYKFFISSANGFEFNVFLVYIISCIITGVILVFFTSKNAEYFDLMSRQLTAMHVGLIISSFLIQIPTLFLINLIIFIILILISRVFGVRLITAFILINPFTFTLGVLLRSLLSTIISIYSYLKQSVYEIASNWRRQMFVVDFHQYPEIMPDIEKSKMERLKFSVLIKQIKNDHIAFIPFFVFIFGPLLLISIIYRISIKSTLWFYIPFLLLVKSPQLENSSKIGEFLSELYQTIWAKWRFVIASITVCAFVLTHFNYYNYSKEINSPFASMIAMLYFDFSSVETWKILQLSVAILTICIFIYADLIRVPKISNNIALEKDFNVTAILYLNIIRNWLSFFYFSSAIIFLSFYFKIWEYDYVPKFIKVFLTTLVRYIISVPF